MVPARPSILLVGNPTAQSGKNAARIQRALRLLQDRGLPCEVLHTAPAGKTVGLVRDAIDQGAFARVISMGGDGTFREVAAGILESRRRDEVALGMLPTGTANDQGRSFGLEAREEALETNIAVFAAGRETRLDAGDLRAFDDAGALLARAFFFDSAGWGLSARVLADRNRDRKVVEKIPGLREVYRDQAVYAGALLKNLAESYVVSDKFSVRALIDGQPCHLTRVNELVVKATRVYGGAWVFDPSSRHDDGLFELVPARGRRDWLTRVLASHQGAAPLTAEALEALGIEASEIHRGALLDLSFEVPPGAPWPAAQIDGEEFVAAPKVLVRVLPRALRLIVP
jgi:diacylglycerol kinase family enzyme